ncbi:MAG: nucleotide exchange factor GrpE, partial [Elusimicrobia bacterium RIFOXYB2_FULL_62_6]
AGEADKAKDYYDQLLRLQADFANYRKRIEKEKPELVCFGKAQMLAALLPLYDLLLQAHQHVCDARGCDDAARMQDVVKGLEMIFKEFSKVFEAEGIKPMEVVGRPYDPMASEIIGIDEGTEENDGLVTEEFQKGYYLGDRVLRPARVKIAKKKAAAPAAPAEEAKEGGKEQE